MSETYENIGKTTQVWFVYSSRKETRKDAYAMTKLITVQRKRKCELFDTSAKMDLLENCSLEELDYYRYLVRDSHC